MISKLMRRFVEAAKRSQQLEQSRFGDTALYYAECHLGPDEAKRLRRAKSEG